MTKTEAAITIATAVALFWSGAAKAETYGPTEPKPWVMPERFIVQPNQTVEEARAEIDAMRRCAKTYALVGAVGGGALDIATTQWNQSSGYREVNPLYGKHASVGEQLAFNVANGAFSYWQITKAAGKYPRDACRTAKIYAGLKMLPGVVNIGVRIRF